ncbi:nucleotide-sugar transporter [Rickenella mellea]|uniref:Nucleotide-sugar transporter n=1 Tax=Rickenella mellea TaxID=50990 RepID=A0A4Y7Q2N0_9AGAM|nr:nucleotide-sugar transporter [Rickenella mellea]
MAQHESTATYYKLQDLGSGGLGAPAVIDTTPRLFGMPLKYVSLITLAIQNAALALIMHYSRISTPPDKKYSAATAVLLVELLKGSISFCIAYHRVDEHGARTQPPQQQNFPRKAAKEGFLGDVCRRVGCVTERLGRLRREVFSPDCWKLSIPAILYVIQNNLQYIAASNLSAATFQVTYQMKILTTAFFSVVLLRRQLSRAKWASLCALALGVGIVQIQSGDAGAKVGGGGMLEGASEMHPLTGLTAVLCACFTSGLAGVYFEMVLKGSHADLWVRNVQLSLFSIVPALVPIFVSPSSFSPSSSPSTHSSSPPPSPPSPSTHGILQTAFANFTPSAYLTILTQVLGGLLTAIVIKHADNILKGFATSLSIILAFLVGMLAFGERATAGFVGGAGVVLVATWVYNRGEGARREGSGSGREVVVFDEREGDGDGELRDPEELSPRQIAKLDALSVGTRDPTRSTSISAASSSATLLESPSSSSPSEHSSPPK